MTFDPLFLLRRMRKQVRERKRDYCDLKALKKRYILPNADKLKHKKCVFLLLTPRHTNLGDHAIALAEITMLQKCGIEYIEITGEDLAAIRAPSLLKFMNGYPILINGGGNLGTLWPSVEELQQNIVRYNPKSAIFILPNTIYYEENEWGRQKLRESMKVYNSHPNLRFYAREQISHKLMKASYQNVKLTPDVVLSLKQTDDTVTRDGCLLCLRSDREKTRTLQEEQLIVDQVKNMFGGRYRYTDMHAPENVLPKDRQDALGKKFREFQGAELVITDRLHAMIFSAITQTPCIVINSKSPKIKGCFEWIKHLGYIRFSENMQDIETLYMSICKHEKVFNNSAFSSYFEELLCDLQGLFCEK